MMNALNLFIGFSLDSLPTDLLGPVCGPCSRADQSFGLDVRISTRLQARLRACGTSLKKQIYLHLQRS